LIDTPPALAFSYVSIIPKLVDAVLFVVGSGINHKEMISRSLKQLTLAPSVKEADEQRTPDENSEKMMRIGKIAGIVLNKMNARKDDYYGYNSKYFKGYYDQV
jgi:Mrp family chromosome partitioning ATPase